MTLTRYKAFFSFLCFFSMAASHAFATPPLMINAQDQPLAVSETHFYVIRHMSDNAGRYQIERSKTYIVKLDTKTSQIAGFHKLQEAEQQILEFPGPSQSSVSANKAFNLYAYLADENAFQTGLIQERAHDAITIEKKKGHYILSRRLIANGEEQSSVLYNSNLAVLIKASHKPLLSDYIGPVPEPMPNKEIYLAAQDLGALSGADCTLNKVSKAPQPLSKWDYRKDPTDYIAYITCRSAGDSLYIQAALPLSLSFRPNEK